MNEEMIKFKGHFTRQFYPKNGGKYEDGDFAILSFNHIIPLEGDVLQYIHHIYQSITVMGNFPYINNKDVTYTIIANVVYDINRGEQIKLATIYQDVDVSTIPSQKVFLKSFLTENQVESLYEHLESPIHVIANEDIERLCEVKGIGVKTAENIIKKYNENVRYNEAYIELANYGLTSSTIKKAVDEYGSPSILINKIKANPYILTDVKGIGFKKADKIALNSGLSETSQFRLQAFIKHILNEGAEDGFSWVSSQVLVNKIEEELGSFEIEDIVQGVNALKEKRVLWDGEVGKVALQRYYTLELKIKNELLRIKNGVSKVNSEGWETRVKQAEKLQGWEYTPEQNEAIKMALQEQVCVIGGKAGSGKTSTALGAIKSLGDISFGQCSLSGKASARLKEATGYESSTIHRLLGCACKDDDNNTGSQFLHHKNNPLCLDVILLDEFPMVGGYLFLSLLEAIPTGSKLILLGDPGQLSAIGCLNIGTDLIASPVIPTVILTKIHRQALKSAVITESIKVSDGEQITDKMFTGKEVRGELQDLELDIYNDNSITMQKVISQFKEKMSWCHDIDEVQIIAPTKNSVYKINNVIQPLYNPNSDNKKEVVLSLENDKEYILRVGDKVINVINNYKMPKCQQNEFGQWVYDDINVVEVFNGYTGKIIDIQNECLIINFPLASEENVIVKPEHWQTSKGIHLGYALTIHKCQGSSFDYPICVFDYTHYILLSKEAVYTAMTRSSKYCTIVAENKALRYAIRHTSVEDKQTFLQDLLLQSTTQSNN